MLFLCVHLFIYIHICMLYMYSTCLYSTYVLKFPNHEDKSLNRACVVVTADMST
jgi:hypothetical protein